MTYHKHLIYPPDAMPPGRYVPDKTRPLVERIQALKEHTKGMRFESQAAAQEHLDILEQLAYTVGELAQNQARGK